MSVLALYERQTELKREISKGSDLTLITSIEELNQKTLLLAAASEFEHNLSSAVRRYVNDRCGGNEGLVSILEAKAISRQFHTWFDFKSLSENPFYAMFGKNFSDHMKAIKKAEEPFAESAKSFLEVCHLRNQLVHSNYVTFPLEKTAEEILGSYNSGCKFITRVSEELRHF